MRNIILCKYVIYPHIHTYSPLNQKKLPPLHQFVVVFLMITMIWFHFFLFNVDGLNNWLLTAFVLAEFFSKLFFPEFICFVSDLRNANFLSLSNLLLLMNGLSNIDAKSSLVICWLVDWIWGHMGLFCSTPGQMEFWLLSAHVQSCV